VDGYARFNTGDYAKAKDEFSEFLARSPESDLADDAQYWIGECYFSQKDYRRAILEFRKVIDQYPFGNRVPHAFLKVGLSYLALGDRERASESLETVVQAFPKSEVATVAQGTLDEIKKSPSH
jgi:tol-pal system protein YbgF